MTDKKRDERIEELTEEDVADITADCIEVLRYVATHWRKTGTPPGDQDWMFGARPGTRRVAALINAEMTDGVAILHPLTLARIEHQLRELGFTRQANAIAVECERVCNIWQGWIA